MGEKDGNDAKGSSRKPRKRMKALFTKIREQMEFYFSDANLHMSKFMKQKIAESTEGYVDLSVFLTFNKIKALTQEIDAIAGALDGKSSLLELNVEKTHVRRVTPVADPGDVDERTVYVECLPQHADHDYIRRLFSSCGKVVYVSLPKYATTGDLKGFGFVEFETKQGADAACKELHNPPVEGSTNIGIFPKSSHQLEAIRKKLPDEEIKATEEKAKEIVQKGETVEDNKEKPVADATKETEGSTEQTGTPTKSNKSKRRRAVSESSVEGGGNSDQAATPAKRKKSEVSTDGAKTVGTEKPVAPLSKKKSRKRKSQSKSTEIEGDKTKTADSDLEKTEDAVPEKIRKLDESDSKTDGDKVDSGKEGKCSKKDVVSEKENNSKKKKRQRRKKPKREKEIPELKVIPKKEWLELRKEYLALQKTSMALMKKTLAEMKNKSNTQEESEKEVKEVKEDKPKSSQLEFKPDVIVKVTAETAMSRKQLKESLGEKYQIAYIDVKDGLTDGHIRCEEASSAQEIVSSQVSGYTFFLLSGEEEKAYWDKATSDREAKLSNKTKPKKRGQQKWLDKAQKVNMEKTSCKHIVFDDD